MRHEMFREGIDVIKRSFEIVPVDGGADYRDTVQRDNRSGFASGTYAVSDRRSPPDRAAGVPIDVRGRRVLAARAEGDAIAFDFRELCERPVSASDIAELADRFRSWTISDVPQLSSCSPEAAQRFVNFVDVLCDADARLDVTSPHEPDQLFDGDSPPPDVARLRSRLRLLRVVSK